MKFYEKMTLEEAQNLSNQLGFFSSHNHTEISNFRLRDCIIRIPDLINRSIELGYNGVCCTDHEALSAHVRLIQHYKDLKENGKLPENFKIGLGNEIYLIDNLEDVTTNYIPGVSKFYHFILIAKDKKGYEQLKRISSESAWKNWFKQNGMERVPTIKQELEDIIGNEKGHLVAQSACLGSELDNLILNLAKTDFQDKTIKKKIDTLIRWCIKIFGKEDFYLEIQPCVVHYDKEENKIVSDQMIVNQFMFKLAKGYGLKIVVTTDSHRLLKEDAGVHEAYLKADDDEKASNREVQSFYETTYLFDKAELIQTLSEYLTKEQIIMAFNGTMDVYSKIEFFDLYHPVIVPTDKKLPKFKIRNIFSEYYDKYEYIKKYSESDDIQDQYLLYLTENGFEKLDGWEDTTYHFVTYDKEGNISEESYKTITLEDKIARINEELSSFWQISEKINQKLSSYYTLVRGLVQEVMWKVSYTGPGRGSAGGSYICYLIEITQINPMKFDLPFWRHSSPLRPELPD